jgi:hypothetical protein
VPWAAFGEPLSMNVDTLTTQLRELVRERQTLRERGAAADELVPNQLEIVRAQWQLTYALTELLDHPELDQAA